MTAAQLVIPKAAWGPGPWQTEPDQALFSHAEMVCFIFRNMLVTGSLCGYVAVLPDHPWWGKEYGECVATPRCEPDPPIDLDDMFPKPKSERILASLAEPRWSCDHRPESLIEVHGGVTYAGPMQNIGNADERPQTFDWGFGFDTGHAGDVCPAMDALLRTLQSEQEWREHKRIMEAAPWGNTYKTFAYVRKEVENMAEQLASLRK